jgi:nucleoside 2-deoxyribosyltransferase
MPSVYLAGPDVFRPDAVEHLQRLARVAEAFGLEGLVPIDGTAAGAQTAQSIYDANLALLRRADSVAANLMPFRGTEPDSGTVFEVGAAVMLGLPVVAYGVGKGDYLRKVRRQVPTEPDMAGVLRDMGGMAIEDFGLGLNLMLACSVEFEDSAEEALKALSIRLGARPPFAAGAF